MSGILHFDVTQGCEAHLLVEALSNLVSLDGDPNSISSALAQKICLLCKDKSELTKQFAMGVAKLNPLAISASHIPLSFSHDHVDRDQILKLSEGLPTRESEWPGPFSDALGIAMLKVVANHFGARGDSVLIKMAKAKTVRAMWCEPTQMPKVFALVEFLALVGVSVDAQELIRRLINLGVRELLTTQVMESGARPRTQIRGLVSYDILDHTIEKLLIDGEASDVTTSYVEFHSLHKHKVEIPFGRGQKQQSCSVIESLWGDRVLRAELVKEDLAALVKTTGFSPESIRSDVMTAWRKLYAQ